MPNPTSLYVLHRISTGEVLKRNAPYPRADGGPIEGLDPDLEYLEMVTDAQPDYDPRYFLLVKTEQKVADKWRTTYGTQKRPASEIKTAVKNKEALELQKQVETADQLKLVMLGLGVVLREAKNLTLTPKEQELADEIVSISSTLWKNDARRKQIETAIDAGQEPDLDSGWELKL